MMIKLKNDDESEAETDKQKMSKLTIEEVVAQG